MRETEARLRAELEAVNGRLQRLDPDMLLLQGVPTDGERFSKPVTNLLVVGTGHPHLPYLVLVDEDLWYAGSDPFLSQVFSEQPHANGWRPLLVAPAHLLELSPAEVARSALRFLGFPAAAVPPLPPGLSADWGYREAHPPLVGRAALLERAEVVLAQETERAGVVLVGPAGVGKTAVARELAWRWQEERSGRTAYRVDVPALLAGVPGSTDRAARVQRLYADVLRLGPGALLVLEELHLLCGGTLGTSALCQAIEAGLHLVATTTVQALPMFRSPALRRRLHFLSVPEPAAGELSADILPTVARYLEVRYGVQVAPESLALLVPASARRSGAQPGKAIRLLDNALARARRQKLSVLGPDDILEPGSPAVE